MDTIELKKEEAAFYFNQAGFNLRAIESNVFDAGKRKTLLENPQVLAKLENFIFNFRDVTKNEKGEIDVLISKLTDLRNYYSHYVHTDNVKVLSKGEGPILARYYQFATEATASTNVKLEIMDKGNKLTDAGVLFFLCMFLKKSQANKLISSISGFKRTDAEGQPRRNLFTYFSVREGYKVVPEMQKHFLLFDLVNHLSNQDEYIEKSQQTYDIGEGLFFHRMASKFLNTSGILRGMKFYAYQSKRLEEKRGKIEPEGDSFVWIEPFQGNSYFEVDGHKGVIGEDELKDLCYALLVAGKNANEAEGKITQFLTKYKKADNSQEIEKDEMLCIDNFPANYFDGPGVGSIKDRVLNRLEREIKSHKDNKADSKAYDKMKEVMDFINNRLPAAEKMKQKDYRRYLKMVRLWNREKGNIEREFKAKEWSKYFPSNFWRANNLEDVYKLARQENARILGNLKAVVEGMSEQEFEKYRQINEAKDLAGLRQLAGSFGVKWEEKDWEEYARQIKERITDRQKLTIMKQRITAELKKRHAIENLNLRITIDSSKSRAAVLNRIALPKGFVKTHILQTPSDKIMKKTREAECKILLSGKYGDLSKRFFDEKNLDKLTQINGLYEKNKIIAFMVVYLMEQLKLGLKGKTKLAELKETRIRYKISDKVTEDIQLSQYPSLVYVIGRKYIDNVDRYKFAGDVRGKPILSKIDLIEKERLEFIRQVLGFEKELFDNTVIDKKNFTDTETHIKFRQIIDELVRKGWDATKLNKLKEARNAALHGEIPEGTSFQEANVLINELKNKK